MPYERDSDVRVKPTGRAFTAALGTLDGALYTSDWIQRQIIKGNGFAASMGELSAPETLQAAVITTRRPSLWLRVPAGVTILPFYTSVTVEDTAATLNLEISLGVVALDPGNGTSSAVTNGPVNLNTGSGNGSLVTPRQDASGDNVAASDITADLWRVIKSEDNVTRLGKPVIVSRGQPRILPAVTRPKVEEPPSPKTTTKEKAGVASALATCFLLGFAFEALTPA